MEENNKIYAELLKVAEQQLPKATADLLRQRLEKLDVLESENEKLKANVEGLIIQRNHFQSVVEDQGKVKALKKELEAKEKDLANREDELWKKEMEMKLQCANDKVNLVTEFTRGLVRNTEFRSSVFGSTNGYNNNQPTSSSYSYTEERKIE